MEEFSRFVFQTVDCIGYSQEIVKVRRNYWRDFCNVINSKNHDSFRIIIAGSKAEGITSIFESDIDTMLLSNNSICTDNVESLSRLPDLTVIHADTSEAPPGYTRLKFISRNAAFSRQIFKECLFESESNDIYLSSSLFANQFKLCAIECGTGERIGDMSGPAVPELLGHNISADYVLAFHCFYAELLHSWKTRPRLYDWPPVDIREEAASMLAQVVPVGSKGSCDQWREWRFCFIESELKLTYSLNETQLKLYIVLKMVAKDILCDVSKEISSYIMKNIIFWLSELLPEVVFKKENVLSLLLLSLRFLQSSINKWNWLPYYMIPGRNLLAERLTPVSRRQLSDLIETLIQEGPQFILRCTKLRTAVYVRLTVPGLIVKYGETRHLVEVLEYCRVLLKLQNADESNIRAIERKLFDIVVPEWRLLKYLGSPARIIDAARDERIRAILW